jgi:hypothetical protein
MHYSAINATPKKKKLLASSWGTKRRKAQKFKSM